MFPLQHFHAFVEAITEDLVNCKQAKQTGGTYF